MIILPAIDIRKGNCVRLYQGREDRETVYSSDPIEMGRVWKAHGATMLHIADLDGAFAGTPVNLDLVAKIRKQVDIPVELGGGFRDIDSIARAYDAGIDRLILGTVAVYNPDLVQQAVSRFGAFIAVSIDVAEDYVAVSGWKEVSTVKSDTLAASMGKLGVSTLLFTDTRKDGTLSGPNTAAIQTFLAAAKVPVIVSGGISTLADIKALRPLESSGLHAVIIGKALYDHRITLQEAISAGISG